MTGVEATLALRAEGVLRDFNRAGVLSAADVHVARRLGAIGGEPDEAVLLAAALVVRSTRHGSVVLDLATAEASTSPDVDDDLASGAGAGGAGPDGDAAIDVPLVWPHDWVARCTASPLVGGPLRMSGTRVWLARYWDQEEQVATELLERCATLPRDLDLRVLGAGLARLFRAGDEDQRLAAACCALSRVSVLAGGPGTGKTTTVSRLLALLREQHPEWRVALAAPTGKAAARLEEAVRSSSDGLPPEDRARVRDLSATTLHRLLGWRPEARSRFRHDRTDRLPFEVVVVDESSMLSLTMMARLLEALRPATRLVLVGDPDQLASVEAGAVLGDLVDRTTLGHRTAAFAEALDAALGAAALGGPAPDATLRGPAPDAPARGPAPDAPARGPAPAAGVASATVPATPVTPAARVRDGVAALSTNRRFPETSGIARLAAAVQDGRGEDALAVLRDGGEVELVEVADDEQPGAHALAGVRRDVVASGTALHAAAERGDAAEALAALEAHRLLCAHRTGPRGVVHWSAVAARWVAEEHPVTPRADGRYAGEPLLVTTNDYEIGLYNGDTGVVVADDPGDPDRLIAAFGRGGRPIIVPLVRLGAVRSLHAMTVHRSQGSQFDRVTVLLPPADSPLGTRETLYTAVTRARSHVRVIGSAEALVAAVGRPAARATGLRERLAASDACPVGSGPVRGDAMGMGEPGLPRPPGAE